MDRGRVEAFSDGVFAVAITLLALNLAVAGPGNGPLLHQLAHQWPAFASYVVSFFMIGIVWVNHHSLFRQFSHVDRMLLFANLLLLLFVVAIPFATATLADYLLSGGQDARVAGALYALVLEGMALSFTVMFAHAVRFGLLKVSIPREDWRAAIRGRVAGLSGGVRPRLCLGAARADRGGPDGVVLRLRAGIDRRRALCGNRRSGLT